MLNTLYLLILKLILKIVSNRWIMNPVKTFDRTFKKSGLYANKVALNSYVSVFDRICIVSAYPLFWYLAGSEAGGLGGPYPYYAPLAFLYFFVTLIALGVYVEGHKEFTYKWLQQEKDFLARSVYKRIIIVITSFLITSFLFLFIF